MTDLMDKKPDFETESLKAWKVPKDQRDQYKEEGILIGKGNTKMKLMGFTEVREKGSKKLQFAYKIRHDKGLFLYHIANDTKKVKALKEFLIDAAEKMGLQPQDSKEILINARDAIRHLGWKK